MTARWIHTLQRVTSGLLATTICMLMIYMLKAPYCMGGTAAITERPLPVPNEQAGAPLPELPERFGNPILRGWHEIRGPSPISWLPTAPGWRVLAVVMLLWLVRRGWRAWRLWWRNRYRREALRRLARSKHCPLTINEILKLAAMAASSRREVASLSGDAWIAWLDQRAPEVALSDDTKTLLSGSLYAQTEQRISAAFSADAARWLRQHRDDHADP